MKKTLAATTALLTICTTAFAALPPGPLSSRHVHVNPSHRMHTPVQNRVHMTPQHGASSRIGGRFSSDSRVNRHNHFPSGRYVRPSLPAHHYYRPSPPPPPPHWRYRGYYSGHYWHPYRISSVWYGAPIACYGYPYYGYYAHPGVHVSVRL